MGIYKLAPRTECFAIYKATPWPRQYTKNIYRVCGSNASHSTHCCTLGVSYTLERACSQNMKKKLTQEANSHSASQKISCLSHNPKVLYHVQQPPLVPILTYINPVHIVTPYFLCLPTSHFQCDFSFQVLWTKFLCIYLTSYIQYPAHLILDLINHKILKYKKNYNFPCCFMHMSNRFENKVEKHI